jgi:hypothetical protein
MLWTHCREQASDREEERNSPGTGENRGPRKTKIVGTNSVMLLKTKKEMPETKLKRTQNELKLSAQMREIEPKFELFDIASVGAGDWIVGDAAGTEIARLGETRGTAREFKNSGNKARMLMKTKDITFLSAANYARFTRNLVPNRA